MNLTAYLLLACLSAAPPAGAPAGVQARETLLDAGYRQMYDREFDLARRTFAAYKAQHPDDPAGPAAMAAAYLFVEFDRLNILQNAFFAHRENPRRTLEPSPETRAAFNREIAASQELAAHRLTADPRDTNALFAEVLAQRLSCDYAGLVEKRNLAALAAMKRGRQLADQLLRIDPDYFDAYLAGGIENYILSQKPLPVRWIVRLGGAQTDKAEGLRRIRLVAAQGHYLKPLARLLLAAAALRDNDTATARNTLNDLVRQFPHNRLYSEELARLR